MLHEDPHLSDQDLLLAVDGELSPRRAAQVREHLAACWACRARVRDIEAAIADFVHVHSINLDPRLPPVAGYRALLKAQLASLAASSREDPWTRMWHSPLIRGRLAYVLATLLFVVLGMVFLYRRPPAPAPMFSELGSGAVPRASLTPGATRPVTKNNVCGADGENVWVIPVSIQRKVFEEYGMAGAEPKAYEVDYLITPELGGANDIRNLWPQPYSATVWNAHVKDALENRLHRLVCEGEVDLATAQRDISTDWISAYKKYFHTETPGEGPG